MRQTTRYRPFPTTGRHIIYREKIVVIIIITHNNPQAAICHVKCNYISTFARIPTPWRSGMAVRIARRPSWLNIAAKFRRLVQFQARYLLVIKGLLTLRRRMESVTTSL